MDLVTQGFIGFKLVISQLQFLRPSPVPGLWLNSTQGCMVTKCFEVILIANLQAASS